MSDGEHELRGRHAGGAMVGRSVPAWPPLPGAVLAPSAVQNDERARGHRRRAGPRPSMARRRRRQHIAQKSNVASQPRTRLMSSAAYPCSREARCRVRTPVNRPASCRAVGCSLRRHIVGEVLEGRAAPARSLPCAAASRKEQPEGLRAQDRDPDRAALRDRAAARRATAARPASEHWVIRQHPRPAPGTSTACGGVSSRIGSRSPRPSSSRSTPLPSAWPRRRCSAPRYAKRRCLVPVDSFFEWAKVKAQGAEAALCHRHGRRRAVRAGRHLGELATPETDDIVRTFCVITTAANEMIADFHDRMPVILAARRLRPLADARRARPARPARALSRSPHDGVADLAAREQPGQRRRRDPRAGRAVGSRCASDSRRAASWCGSAASRKAAGSPGASAAHRTALLAPGL